MDWDWIIEKNRDRLRQVLVTLVVMVRAAGTTGAAAQRWAYGPLARSPLEADADARDLAVAILPRRLHRAVLRLLRPAESAARRLVIAAARGLVVPPSRPRLHKPAPKRRSAFLKRNRIGTGIILPRGVKPPAREPVLRALPMFDPLRRVGPPRRRTARDTPRVITFGPGAPPPAPVRRPPLPDDLLDARRLVLRLQALGMALDDLPRLARRFARWRHASIQRGNPVAPAADTKRPVSGAQGTTAAVAPRAGRRFRRLSPLRFGRPPGQRRKQRDEGHELLSDLHYFAGEALADTS